MPYICCLQVIEYFINIYSLNLSMIWFDIALIAIPVAHYGWTAFGISLCSNSWEIFIYAHPAIVSWINSYYAAVTATVKKFSGQFFKCKNSKGVKEMGKSRKQCQQKSKRIQQENSKRIWNDVLVKTSLSTSEMA